MAVVLVVLVVLVGSRGFEPLRSVTSGLQPGAIGLYANSPRSVASSSAPA